MRRLVWSLLAAGTCVLAGGAVVGATDVVRLGGPSAADAIGDSDTQLVRYRGGWGGGGWGGGGWGRGGWGGGGWGRGGWGGGWGRGVNVNIGIGRGWGGGWGGYPGYWGGGYRGGYWGGGWGRGGYWGGYPGWGYTGWGGGWGGYGRPYWGGYYSSYSYPIYYSSPIYYSTPAYSYSYVEPCATQVMPYATSTYSTAVTTPLPTITSQPRVLSPQSAPLEVDGQTYPYDGGPGTVIPEATDVNPTTSPRRQAPPAGTRFVSLPREATGGSTPLNTAKLFRLSDDRPATPAAAPSSRYTYRAYGEEPLPPVSRTPATPRR